MVLLASGGIGMPALQTMLSRQVDEERQGSCRLTGGAHQPDLDRRTLLFTAIYAAGFYNNVDGWAWIAGAALCLLACRRCVAGFG